MGEGIDQNRSLAVLYPCNVTTEFRDVAIDFCAYGEGIGEMRRGSAKGLQIEGGDAGEGVMLADEGSGAAADGAGGVWVAGQPIEPGGEHGGFSRAWIDAEAGGFGEGSVFTRGEDNGFSGAHQAGGDAGTLGGGGITKVDADIDGSGMEKEAGFGEIRDAENAGV